MTDQFGVANERRQLQERARHVTGACARGETGAMLRDAGLAALMLLAACSRGGGTAESADTVNTAERADLGTLPPNDAMPAAEPHIVPIPPNPAALRGCWEMDDPEHRDDTSVLRIRATAIEERASWRKEVVIATAESVQRVGRTGIDGLFSAPEGEHRMTVATMLSLGPDDLGTPVGKLRLSEGDAGSRWYRRCKHQPQDAK